MGSNVNFRQMMEYLPYYGGKGGTSLGSWIYNHFDLNGINNYVEAFSGMFGIYFGNFSDFSTVKNIVYNDIDTQNCNVISCAQYPLAFLNEIHKEFKTQNGIFNYPGLSEPQIYANYKQLFNDYHKGIRTLPAVPVNANDYQSAVIYSFLRIMAFKAMHYLKIGPRNMMHNTWYKRYKVLQPVVNKLTDNNFVNKVARINVNAVDYKIIMNRYNSTDSFIYLDPPYFDREKTYDHYDTGVFGKNDHIQLANLVKQSKANVAVSYYDFPGIYQLYPKNQFTFDYKSTYNSAAGKTSTEILIMNFTPPSLASNQNSPAYYTHKGVYFTKDGEKVILELPEEKDSIYEYGSEEKQVLYRGSHYSTISCIIANGNNTFLCNDLSDAGERIDELISKYAMTRRT
jgi:site-specific DNA-adenine methylase